MYENAGVAQKDIKMFCDTTQFPSLQFCGPHTKPHSVRGLNNPYTPENFVSARGSLFAKRVPITSLNITPGNLKQAYLENKDK